ncbi:putative 5'-3' exonuclease XRNC [Leishmania mexicana MHOM/GT/2001/U1103]|uniref:5'-3' exonuclease XRNC n=1 Tax=Leishmania mexicana (strain MHOM/GT/2001/U1103) TaxID=929439 RepID=E9AW59_LEIMU|nr:putative 5'-3' exonuclease XRNC [Leishmania mexicana MHOM/GT/2001/U1103]CBZ27193.1 putative 5'-3' exonuclease XRNC [Leishmania mexicana MHOM/GT/2001/U1103]
MGVPLLLTWLRKRFADCFMPADSAVTDYIRRSTDNLFIDLNSFLYQAATIITATHRTHRFHSVDEVEDVVLRKLFDLLDDLVMNLVQPKALVYIAVDGVSPLGKMSQQRARRRRGARRQSSASPSSSFRHHEPAGNINDLWDSNCISVGTRFMAKVTEALHFYAVSRTERINAKRLREERVRIDKADASVDSAAGDSTGESYVFPFISIIVDDVLRPGEGENKIAEFIRRIRADPSYGPNTSHVICSSDTDVTVTSLILHEPRIHVLRYEPPVSLGGKLPMKPQPPAQHHHQHRSHHQHVRFSSHPHRGSCPSSHGPRRVDGRSGHAHHSPPRPSSGHGDGAAAQPPPPKDSWLSTFFSIHVFRQRLREILHLSPGNDAASAVEGAAVSLVDAEEAALTFEHALHDVVFVLLLFGNDFLPTIGGSIQEGTLDALLALLATDFVPRGRTLVDPATNRIQYASARYLLSCLAELPGNAKKGGSGGRLQVHNGGSDALDWGFTAEKEAKERDPAFIERQQRREKQHERMCYCYWTMLQWALQYSAGIVEHWGCYYPYGRAPPLSKLATYCGVLTYNALGEIARRRLEMSAAAGRVTSSIDGEVENATEEEDDDDGMDGLPTSALQAGETGTAVIDAAERGKPTDVMVQLLILIPPRSVALLPTVFRHHYKEVEAAVQAPVEQLNLVSIGAWCEEKKRSLSEEERTRFTAYQFFASDADLGTAEAPFPARDIAFTAYWNGPAVQAELAALRVSKKATSATPGTTFTASATSSTAAAGLQSKAASFFSMGRRPTSGTSSNGGAAALLAAVNINNTRTSPPPAPATAEIATPLEETPASPSTEVTPALQQQNQPVKLRHPAGDYVLWVVPCDALQDALMVKALGTMHGNRFCVGSYVPLVEQDAVLSRSGGPRQEVRLQFRLVVAPVITDTTYAARLLSGYEEPAEVGMRERIAEARKEEADQADPWKQLDKMQTLQQERKRARDVENEHASGEGELDGDLAHAAPLSAGDDGQVPQEVELQEQRQQPQPQQVTLDTVDSTVQVADAEALLKLRKEEVRRRLTALKAARQAAQQDE